MAIAIACLVVPGQVSAYRENMMELAVASNPPIIVQNQSYSRAFTSAGSFPYHCAVHPSMRDTIFVGAQTGIGNEPISAPINFELSQNYPNPFNASTLIKYSLSRPAHVTVDIFDMLGRKVLTMADGEENAGAHEVVWNAPDQASGIFFYRVSVDDQSKTGRMVLLK